MKVSICGTGLMGSAIADRLRQMNVEVVAYNRTIEKARLLQDLGVVVVESPQQVFEQTDIILLTLSEKSSIDAVISQCSASVFKGKTIVQMGTIAPSQSQELEQFFMKQGAQYIECPVIGSRNEARGGVLIMMAGGDKNVFDASYDLLKMLASNPRYVGDVGKAAILKLSLNSLIISHVVGFSLSLGLAKKGGVSIDQFMETLKESSLYAPMIEKKLSRWVEDNYDDPNFPVKHLLKDCNLVIDQMNVENISTDVLISIRRLLESTIEQGLGDGDYSAIYKTINNC